MVKVLKGYNLVIVSVGIGKIFMIVGCILYLFDNGIKFEEILFLIFINKVSNEMIVRVVKYFKLSFKIEVGIFYVVVYCYLKEYYFNLSLK